MRGLGVDRDTPRDVDDRRDERAGTRLIGCSSRRAVLLGVGGAGAAVALAACGAGGSSTGGGASSGGTGGGQPSDAQPSNDLGATAAIPVGGGKVFFDQLVVVTQPSAGAFKAFTAVCTHEGCTVNQVANGLIVCPCHGSEYSITDGAVKAGPALRPLGPKRITVSNGQITLD